MVKKKKDVETILQKVIQVEHQRSGQGCYQIREYRGYHNHWEEETIIKSNHFHNNIVIFLDGIS
jgi:stalled ribosome alternative rescue factor ArfA